MKLYGIEPHEEEFQWGKMKVVVLGEKGRGRKYVYVPFQADTVEGDDFQIGSTQSGAPKIIKGKSSSEGWIAKLSAQGTYTRGTYGSVYIVNEDIHKVKVIASGFGAYGDAGRVGEWNEFLVEINPVFPVRFWVRPSGGEYKIPRYWLVFVKDEVIKVRSEEKTLFIEQTGIHLPISISKLVNEFWHEYEIDPDILTDLSNLVEG